MQTLLSAFARTEVADEIEKFFIANSPGSVASTVRLAVDSIRVNACQLKRDWTEISNYLGQVA